jgi:small subunit ribosomal protein S18
MTFKENKDKFKKDGSIMDQDGYLRISLVNQDVPSRKRRSCPLSEIALEEINYKNLPLLAQYISERGKITPRRISGVCAKKQRALAKAIKRARNLALLSFIEGPESKDNKGDK